MRGYSLRCFLAATLSIFFFNRLSYAITVFEVDFDSPTYDGTGFPALVGQDGWVDGVAITPPTPRDSNWVQAADPSFGTGQVGAVGYRSPQGVIGIIWDQISRPLINAPILSKKPTVTIEMQMRFNFQSPTDSDSFGVRIFNQAGFSVSLVTFDVATLQMRAVGLPSSSGVASAPGIFSADTTYRFYTELDFKREEWSISIDGGNSFIFEDLAFEGIDTTDLNMGYLSFEHVKTGFGPPGENIDNYMLIDDILITAVPEPTTGFLLLSGGLVFLANRRK